MVPFSSTVPGKLPGRTPGARRLHGLIPNNTQDSGCEGRCRLVGGVDIPPWVARMWGMVGEKDLDRVGLVGALIFKASGNDECDPRGGICETFVDLAETAAFVYLQLGGALVGEILGALIKTWHWVPADDPQNIRPAACPSPLFSSSLHGQIIQGGLLRPRKGHPGLTCSGSQAVPLLSSTGGTPGPRPRSRR